jgi:hypothetical protein
VRPAGLRTTLAVLVGLSVASSACQRPDAQARAEAARLKRQTEGLRGLLKRADAGTLLGPESLVVGVRQELVRDLLQAQLPVERLWMERFRLLLDKAEVRFEGSQSLVTFEGHVEAASDPGVYADLTCTGGLEEIEIDPETGVLAARVVLDHVDVERVGAGVLEEGFARSVVEGLGGRGLGALGEVVPPLEIPVRFDRAIESPGFQDGALRVAPARLPLRTTVKAVVPVTGRLWVVLDVASGTAAAAVDPKPVAAGEPTP